MLAWNRFPDKRNHPIAAPVDKVEALLSIVAGP